MKPRFLLSVPALVVRIYYYQMSLCIGVSSVDFFMEANAMKTPLGNKFQIVAHNFGCSKHHRGSKKNRRLCEPVIKKRSNEIL